MTPEKKQQTLRRLMGKMSRQKFADEIDYSKAAVDTWLAPESAEWHVTIPDRTLEAIRQKLRAKNEP